MSLGTVAILSVSVSVSVNTPQLRNIFILWLLHVLHYKQTILLKGLLLNFHDIIPHNTELPHPVWKELFEKD